MEDLYEFNEALKMNKKEIIANTKRLAGNVYPHFDRITLYADSSLGFLDMDRLTNKNAKGKKPKIIDCVMAYHPAYKFKLRIFQPSLENLQYLCDAISTVPVNFSINYAEVTFDFISSEPLELTTHINNHLVKTRRGESYHNQDRMKPLAERTCYWGNRNQHNFCPVTYSDRDSKIAHQPCAHLEFRIHGKANCARHTISVPTDLLNFNFERFFRQNAIFYVHPSKAVIGQAIAADRNIFNKSKRCYEKIFENRVKKKIHLLDPTPKISYQYSVQELLSKIPGLKKILHTKKYKIINDKFTMNMQDALLKNMK